MKLTGNVFALGLAAATIACGGVGPRGSDQRSGHDPNEATKSVNSQPAVAMRTALVGCLRAGEQAGSFTLLVTGDTADRTGTGTSGSSTAGRPAPAASSTTGAGGDAVRNAPTIGGGATPLTYRVVIADGSAAADAGQNVDRQVSVVGVVEDNATANGTSDAASGAPMSGGSSAAASRAETHTIRAASITKIADRCSGDRR
jgi:hypothetical protein